MTDRQPSLNELADRAERAWRDLLVAESQMLQPGSCCLDESWRGHLCPYHQGFADGIDAVLERMHAIKEMTSDR